MKHKLKIGLRLFNLNTLDASKPGNIHGDELVARSWEKYLNRREDVESVHLYGPSEAIAEEIDVLIHFNPYLDLHPKVKNILYLQNAFSKQTYPGGTIGVFKKTKSRFDGYIFTSEKLMQACASGAVVPFATDPDFFYPQPSDDYQHPVSFVGNDIRGPVVNLRYFEPALPFGLVIYGNLWSGSLSQVWRGKLPMPDLPKLYSSSFINLNAHIEEHIELDTINLRIYDILACGGFIISDPIDAIASNFGDNVVLTQGYEDEWAKLVHYLADPDRRRRRSQEGQAIVLSNHTYTNRVNSLMAYLKEVL